MPNAISRTFILTSLVLVAGCQGFDRKKIMGGVEVQNEKVTAPTNVNSNTKIYVADFALAASDVKTDPLQGGIREELGLGGGRGPMSGGGLLSRLKGDSGPTLSGSAEDQAKQIVNGMAESLVKDFNDKGIPAERISGDQTQLPKSGWLIQGQFTQIDEGNRMERAIIGFGTGATSMDVQVGISDLASDQPKAPFAVFGTIKDPGKMPGAVATLNPYVAAAKFHMEKNATGKDVGKTADEIVTEVVKFRSGTAKAP